MAFYVAGPFFNLGTKMDRSPLWHLRRLGIYGGIYFLRSSKAKARQSC